MTMDVPVQRLVLLLPKSEQDALSDRANEVAENAGVAVHAANVVSVGDNLMLNAYEQCYWPTLNAVLVGHALYENVKC